MNDYKIEIEIFEGKGGCLKKNGNKIIYPQLEKEGICAWMYRGDGEKSYQKGRKFIYPDENGKICPWLMDSLNPLIRVLKYDGTLPWDYKDTKYEKIIDPDGITTEFVRCIDPTDSGIVVKVTRIKI